MKILPQRPTHTFIGKRYKRDIYIARGRERMCETERERERECMRQNERERMYETERERGGKERDRTNM